MEVVNIQKHKNNIVSKANELVRAKGALCETAQKMLASIISMIRFDDTELQEYALKIDDYLALIDSKSNNNKFIKEQAKELMKNPFEIDGLIFNWCSMVDTKRIEGYLIFDIHPKLRPYLLELKERGNFTQYKIINILSLKGEYSPRFYEILIMKWNIHKKYNPLSKSLSFDMKIDELIDMLQIPRGYRYADIRRRIIDKAQKQFKAKTDIQFTYKEQKIGRKVDRLIITIKANDKGSNDYLSSLHSFIAYMRKHFINKDILKTKDKYTGEYMMLSVSEKGHIYNKYNTAEIEKERAKEIWETLYKLAKQNKLECLQAPINQIRK